MLICQQANKLRALRGYNFRTVHSPINSIECHSYIKSDKAVYETEGIEAFMPHQGNRRYAPAVKEAAVKDYLSGRGGLRKICKIYKIRSTGQLRAWIKVYKLSH